MKTIIIAIDNLKIYNEIKRNSNIKIIGKDLIYKEAVLEILERNKNVDLIILYEKILGEINFFELIKKIKNINKKIKIIIILENKNEKLEKKLKKINIKNIFLKNKINSKKIIEIINEKNNIIKNNNKKINKNKNIKKINTKINYLIFLKKIKDEKFLKENLINNFRKNFFILKILNRIKIKFKKNSKHNKKRRNETIVFIQNKKNPKRLVSLQLNQKLKENKNKISIINLTNNTKNKTKYKNNYNIQKEIEKELKKYKNKKSILNLLKNEKTENKKINNEKNKKISDNKLIKNKKISNKKNIKQKNIKKIKIKLNKNKIIKKYKLKIDKIKNKNNNKYLKNKKIEKNKTENKKIIKKIKNYLLNKTKNNMKIYSNFYLITKNTKNNSKRNKEKIIEIILEIIKTIQEESKYTIIEIDSLKNTNLIKEVLKISNKIVVPTEGNILGVKATQRLIDVLKKINIFEEKSLHILINKTSKNMISIKILKEIFKRYEVIKK